MKRLFIAINLPEDVKEVLAEKQEDIRVNFEEDPVKWVAKQNLHITLAFLGSVKKNLIPVIEEELEKIDYSKFNFNLDNIEYTPNRREAKMIWVTGISDKLKKIQKEVDKTLISINELSYKPDSRDFLPHVTLGRVKSFEFRNQSLESIPLLEDEFVNLNFKIKAFDLMESKLKRSGPEYKKIKSINLK